MSDQDKPDIIKGSFWYNERGQVVAHFEDGSRPFTTHFTSIDALLTDIGWKRRPDNYEGLSPREQWAVDKKLGLLDEEVKT